MSAPDKPDTARGWEFAEGLLAKEEAERIAKLSDGEFEAEMRREGKDPARVPSGEELLARVAARAARKSAETPRLAEAAPAKGANGPPRVAQAVPIETERARRRPRGLVWLLAAALVLGVLFVVAVKGPAIVAYFEGPKIGPDNERIPPPTPHEFADKIRDDAMGHCAQLSWTTCKEKLDEAAKLDPAGESEARVRAMRENIEATGRPADAAVKEKPGR